MKKFNLLLLSSFFATAALADCNPTHLGVVRERGFSLSFGGGSSSSFETKSTTNIPLVIDGKRACYHQTNKLEIRTERKKDKEYVEFEITPMEADFENVPDPSVVHYLNVDQNRVQMMSFLCSGETPIGAEGFSDSLLKLSVSGPSASVKVSSTFATGIAARNLYENERDMANDRVYDSFLELYRDRAKESMSEEETLDIFIPSVITRTTIESRSSLKRSLYSSFFSRTGFTVNGCSKAFREVMDEFRLEKIAKNKSMNGIELKKKAFSSKYRMRWTL